MFDMTIVDSRTGEKTELTIVSRDLLIWERTTKGANLKSFQDAPKIDDMYSLAYFAGKRTGDLSGIGREEFETKFDVDFESMAEDSDDEVRPTPGDRGIDG